MLPDDALKVGDRVRYTGEYTPRLKGKTGVVLDTPYPHNTRVKWDDATEKDIGVYASNLTRIEPETKFKVGDRVRILGGSFRSGVVREIKALGESRHQYRLNWEDGIHGVLWWADFELESVSAPDTHGEAMPAGVLVGNFVKYRGNFVRVKGVKQTTRVDVEHASGTVETIDADLVTPVDDLANAA